MSNVPPAILAAAEAANKALLPVKSKDKYLKTYEMFTEWRLKNSVTDIEENVILAFFYEKSQSVKSSTLWNLYSMIRSTIQLHHNIDISKYSKVLSYLKRQNDTYKPKKSKVFTSEDVHSFIKNAPDNSFLLMKVVLIFGLNDACRCAELINIKTEDIQDTGTVIRVELKDTKTKKNRFFTITAHCNGYDLYQRYAKLRPGNINHNRFFIYYNSGKCTSQPIGIHTLGKIPQRIAEFLNLPDYKLYTGHCLRRTSATFLADSGADMNAIKRHGGWRSTTVAEGYLEDSLNNKIRNSENIFKFTHELGSTKSDVKTTDISSTLTDSAHTTNSLNCSISKTTDNVTLLSHREQSENYFINNKENVPSISQIKPSSIIKSNASSEFLHITNAQNCNITIYKS